jgi:hypothetical protein
MRYLQIVLFVISALSFIVSFFYWIGYRGCIVARRYSNPSVRYGIYYALANKNQRINSFILYNWTTFFGYKIKKG